MNQKISKKINLKNRFAKYKTKYLLKISIFIILGWMLINLIFNSTVKLYLNSSKPIDAYLVLGGSVNREIYVSKLAKLNPEIPIIISQGSKDPCIFLIFQREKAPMNNVWLEKCAASTFGNFFFSIPILKKWGVHKVKVITSNTHLPRAKLMAKIFLFSQGIALDLDIVKKEQGIPGNYENTMKTILDISRSVLWAFGGQLINPSCHNLINLAKIDLDLWYKTGFDCESQAKLKIQK